MGRISNLFTLGCWVGLGGLGFAAENSLTPAEQKAGWKLLFDGKSAEAFRTFKKDSLNPQWKVTDGALVRTGNGAGDIITRDQFGNFELLLDFKISKGGNSGLMFKVTENATDPWHTGPEVQIQDNVDGHDPQKAGWLYQLYQTGNNPMTQKPLDTTRPAGEWNQMRLLVCEDRAELFMNGHHYWTCKIGDKAWNDRLAKSKFAKLEGFAKAAKGHICLQDHGNEVAFRNIKVREVDGRGNPRQPVDGELPVKLETVFSGVKWAGYKPVDDQDKPNPLRPIIVTHAGDGSGRLFMADQHGTIHVVPREGAGDSKLFLDLTSRVRYSDKENEEGFLGLAFHPRFKENGEFFCYFTNREMPRKSIVSRFRLKPGSADEADLKSEEVLMQIDQPFWNHNGGTIAFGPDGKLYIALGDGGAANDPFEAGQRLDTILGKILRIDVDSKDAGKNYAIPKDNPFVGKDGARGEIWALGLRNPWRIAFDSKTGALFCADVGQNLWEEIDVITKGGNYGWNIREANKPFGNSKRKPPVTPLIDPIWEYDHQVGKSITGGFVYRGKAIPELVGKYLYADYVSGKVWALDYDQQTGQVKGNYAIPSPMLPVITFGEDEAGEAYLTIVSAEGKGIYKFVPTTTAAAPAPVIRTGNAEVPPLVVQPEPSPANPPASVIQTQVEETAQRRARAGIISRLIGRLRGR
jgi:glucose/arabinose dehydrogenase